MPKIIANLENRLMEEAGNQVATSGYSEVTIRSVAAACGVGVGTVYNYFPSKDDLLAAYMLRDWKACIAAIEAVRRNSSHPEPVVRSIYDQLHLFAQKHQGIFRDPSAAASFAGSFSRYHKLLRTQLSQPLEKFCKDSFRAEFLAEALLTWTMDGRSFEEIYGILENLF